MHKPIPKKKRWRFLHDEVHPTLTHGAIALGGFLGGVLLVGAMAVNATDAPAPSLTSQVADILARLTKVETRLTRLDGGEAPEPASALGPISSCDSLSAAFPAKTEWAAKSSDVTCKMESIVGLPQKKFLRVKGVYQYADSDVVLQDVVLEIFDLKDDTEARTTFLTKSAYEPANFNLVKRQANVINKMDGIFTYEGAPVQTKNFTHGANWFVYQDRFGILVHGSASALRLADKTKLDDLVSKVDLEALAAIQ